MSFKTTIFIGMLVVLSVQLAGCAKEESSLSKPASPVQSAPAEISLQAQENWPKHLQSAPSGWVSAQQALPIYFSHSVIGQAPLSQALEGVVVVEPPIELVASFTNAQTLNIQPARPLSRGLDYHFTVFPNKLDGIPDTLSPFQFVVRAYEQDLGVQIDGLRIGSAENDQTISGVVTINDGDYVDDIEKIIDAEQENRDLPIKWSHESDTKHRFTINNISRTNTASSVKITWDGAVINVAKHGSQTIQIPSLESFVILNIAANTGADQYVTVHFSEPLDRRQSLRGLVTLNDQEPQNLRVDGNALRVYSKSPMSGLVSVKVFPGIRSTRQSVIADEFSQQLVFLQEFPGVRFKGSAHILPDQDQLVIPIEAVNVDAVQITAYRTARNNIGQFLQNNNLQIAYNDNTTATPLWRTTYRLPEVPKDAWQEFQLDLTEPLNKYKNDLIALEISIDRSHSIIDCGVPRPLTTDQPVADNTWPVAENLSVPNWVDRYYQSSGRYVWQDRDDPCKEAFYRYNYHNTNSFRYLQASNIGLIAKMASDHSMVVVTTDIGTTQPLKNVEITAYNFQHQPVGQASTNSQGMAIFTPVSAPHYLLAKSKEDLGFLRLPRNEALTTNVFDVGGERASSGLKGFFYGERGIWRPGDDIYLTFIAQDRTGQLPQAHPLTLDFFDPKGSKQSSQTHTQPVNGFYHFKLATTEDAITGNWRAVIRYGGQYFDKVIPVEAIVPNRLKIEMDFREEELSGALGTKFPVKLFSQWLNGATASDLKTDVEMNVRPIKTNISGYDGYVFDDPVKKINSQPAKVFDGRLDGDGQAQFSLTPNIQTAPGKLRLNFTARVFEKSGNFSTQYSSVDYLPFDKLVGINIPKGNGWNNAISRNEDQEIALISLDAQGEVTADVELKFELYRIDWRWWWDNSGDDLSSYVNSTYSNRLKEADITTDENGRANWQLVGRDYDWGRYLIRACVKNSNHCTGEVVYLGWSYNQQKNPSGDTQLILTTDKDRYSPGESARITIPQLQTTGDAKLKGKILLTIESGTQILDQRWIESDIVDGQYSLPVDAAMAPNVYAHLTLIQPYLNKENDSPVRLYGIVPLHVEDPDTHLQPIIEVADKVRPQSTVDIEVREKNGKQMTYTLAVVDEGLLGITNYRTPNPHDALFKRESLGVLTWDLYDLLPRQLSTLNRLITIGGSDGSEDGEEGRRNRRFPPVVKFLGPFNLAANQSAQHTVELPEYMGAVRVMVVAGWQGKDNKNIGRSAYGRAEKTVTVTQPLTLLTTLPRVLGPNETLAVPVNVFVTETGMENVNIQISASNNIEILDGQAQLRFDEIGDQIASLKIRTGDTIGQGSITVTASSGSETISQTINLPIRTANRSQQVQQSAVVQPGESINLALKPNGMRNTNKAYLEVSRVPQIDLQNRLQYLIGYPHGCLEQTTSKLFPQLYLNNLTNLSEKQQRDVEANIRDGISKYRRFQNAAGDFSYWPNGAYSNTWANNYAGHLLLEAKRLGYFVPTDLLSNWLNAQKRRVQTFGSNPGYESTDAYTLYTLALANQANFNAMNRLKEQISDPNRRRDDDVNYRLARWLLAAAYAKAGVMNAADELMKQADNSIYDYRWAGYTYGSNLRDTALLSLVWGEMARTTQAWEAAQEAAQQFSHQSWYSTHSTAWTLMALGRYFANTDLDKSQALSWRINNGVEENVSLVSPLMQQAIANPNDEDISVAITNQSNEPFYVLLANTGIPANAQETPHSEGIAIDVTFTDNNGRSIDVSDLRQGMDFIANVRVFGVNQNFRLENLALEMVMPSGWQISNERLQGMALPEGIEYQDIRDDRVLSYFTLGNYYWYHRNNDREVRIKVKLNASYAGKYYLPGWHVYSMYDENIKANTVGQWVEISGP